MKRTAIYQPPTQQHQPKGETPWLIQPEPRSGPQVVLNAGSFETVHVGDMPPRAHAKQIRWPKVASTDWCGEFEYEPKEPVPPHVGRYMVGGA